MEGTDGTADPAAVNVAIHDAAVLIRPKELFTWIVKGVGLRSAEVRYIPRRF